MQFEKAKSNFSTKVSYDQSSLPRGRVRVLAHVFASGYTLMEENSILGVGENPRGGIHFEPVANIRISSSFTADVSSKNQQATIGRSRFLIQSTSFTC